MSFLLGIAFFEQFDDKNRPICPHWALVAQPTSRAFRPYTAPNTFIYQITRQPPANKWVLNHLAYTLIANAIPRRLIGIVHLKTFEPTEEHPLSLAELDRLVKTFDAKKDHRDESGLPIWSCEGWVIRVLRELAIRGHLTLTDRLADIYPLIRCRIKDLMKASHGDSRLPLRFIPVT